MKQALAEHFLRVVDIRFRKKMKTHDSQKKTLQFQDKLTRTIILAYANKLDLMQTSLRRLKVICATIATKNLLSHGQQ